MKASQFLGSVDLHDSIIVSVRYSQENKVLLVRIKLANYMQEHYHEDDPELTLGELAFSGVTELQADPTLDSFSWGQNLSAQILVAEQIPQNDRDEQETVRFIVSIIVYPNREVKTLIFNFWTTDVEWTTIETA